MIDAAGLRVIQAVAQGGSFTAAAQLLGSSQPAVSQMVRRLEDRLGTPLVARSGRAVRLTEAGEVLAGHALTVLRTLETAEDDLAALTGLQRGRVRLMAFPSASASLVPRALAVLKRDHPGVSISFTEAEPPESLAAVRAGSCDLAVAFTYEGVDVGRGEEDVDSFVVTDLIEDDVKLAVPRTHPLADSPDGVDVAALAQEAWIAGCPRCRGHLVALTQAAGFTPDVAFETEDYVAVMGLIAEGLGIAVIPDLILRTVHHRDVVALPLRPTSRRRISAVTTPDLLRVPAVAALLHALQDSASRLS